MAGWSKALASGRSLPGTAWTCVGPSDYCVLLGRGRCDGLIPRPHESHQLWCVNSEGNKFIGVVELCKK